MRKGELTRNTVIDKALALSTQVGLEGLSIGKLATELSLSKSGLFAHFQSKEALEVAVVGRAAEIFAEVVVSPALKAKAGEPRLAALFDNWIRWPEKAGFPGGCFFIAVASELDDREGPARAALAQQMGDLDRTIARIAADAIRLGQFRADVDPMQVAFEMSGMVLSLNQSQRLLRDPKAMSRARAAFEALLLRSRA